MEIEQVYETEHGKLGFQRGSNTECAIVSAVNQLRHALARAALLDLEKAYDRVPRAILQSMLEERLPPTLTIMIRPLLAPMALRTKNQRSNLST